MQKSINYFTGFMWLCKNCSSALSREPTPPLQVVHGWSTDPWEKCDSSRRKWPWNVDEVLEKINALFLGRTKKLQASTMTKFEDSFWVLIAVISALAGVIYKLHWFNYSWKRNILHVCFPVYKFAVLLLFVNRNRKATKNYANCVAKEMSFAAKFQQFSMRGRNDGEWIIAK